MTTISKPSTSLVTDFGRVSAPIYVGINTETAKKILEVLRDKVNVAEPPTRQSTISSVTVADATLSTTQIGIEQRLRVDLQTLRFILFDSMSRGIALDLAMRIQNELGDELTIVSEKIVQQAWRNSLTTYKAYAKTN